MNQNTFIENRNQAPTESPIEAVRRDLAAWSAGKPKAVQNAVRNLDGWLDLAESRETLGVNVLACTARAVETLRRATGRA